MVCWCSAHPGFTVCPGLFGNCVTKSGARDICKDGVGAFTSVAEAGDSAERSQGRQALTSWVLLVNNVPHPAREKKHRV